MEQDVRPGAVKRGYQSTVVGGRQEHGRGKGQLGTRKKLRWSRPENVKNGRVSRECQHLGGNEKTGVKKRVACLVQISKLQACEMFAT